MLSGRSVIIVLARMHWVDVNLLWALFWKADPPGVVFIVVWAWMQFSFSHVCSGNSALEKEKYPRMDNMSEILQPPEAQVGTSNPKTTSSLSGPWMSFLLEGYTVDNKLMQPQRARTHPKA